MDHPLIDLIDAMVAQAKAEGAFDDLSGAGKPIADLHATRDPLLDRLMQESGTKPLIVQLNQQISQSRSTLAGLTRPDARKAEMKVLSDLQTRYAVELESQRKRG